MKRDSQSAPLYPVTYQWPGVGNTGNVWSWVFWWCRNGQAFVAAAPTQQERIWRERARHSIRDEIEYEAALLPWGRTAYLDNRRYS